MRTAWPLPLALLSMIAGMLIMPIVIGLTIWLGAWIGQLLLMLPMP